MKNLALVVVVSALASAQTAVALTPPTSDAKEIDGDNNDSTNVLIV